MLLGIELAEWGGAWTRRPWEVLERKPSCGVVFHTVRFAKVYLASTEEKKGGGHI